MTEIALIIDLHKDSGRQGPGSEAETLRALEFMELPTDRKLLIADIGCGTGGQTITLAQNLNAYITAVDLFPEFLDRLNQTSGKLGLTDKIQTLQESMDDLSLEPHHLDIIWSEGAIYNIGFETGIKKWKDYLKIGGYLAVSEITWITPNRPKELEEYWMQQYPEIDTASNKIRILEKNGYTLVGYFQLRQESWIENYYRPLEERFESFLKQNNHSEPAMKVVEEHRAEIDLYLKYRPYYSYGFYVAKRN